MVKTHKTTRIESEETVRYKYPFTMQPRDDAGLTNSSYPPKPSVLPVMNWP